MLKVLRFWRFQAENVTPYDKTSELIAVKKPDCSCCDMLSYVLHD